MLQHKLAQIPTQAILCRTRRCKQDRGYHSDLASGIWQAEEKARIAEKEEELAETIDRLEDEKSRAIAEAEESHESSVQEIEQRQVRQAKPSQQRCVVV